jgi:cell division protease FtsH
MEANGVDLRVSRQGGFSLLGCSSTCCPILLLVGGLDLLHAPDAGRRARRHGLRQVKAKLLTENKHRVTFEDVAGVDEAKEELQEVVDFLKDPAKFQRLGGKIPKGALLVGPPGTGKTLLARAVAGEAGVPFFSISGSDFVEMFVGVGASRVRDMFEQAKKNAPCIIFIDEIDAVGRHRGAGLGGGNDEREQTLNQLLVEMDGFEATEASSWSAATNRPDVLDPPAASGPLRPSGRGAQPDVNGRERILRVHMRNVPLAADVDVKTIARGTPGLLGRDLGQPRQRGALMAARKNRRMVTMADFEDAKDKVMMGAERKSMVMTEEEKRMTAYHEGGHALVALTVPTPTRSQGDHHPRGRALGMVMQLPERDKLSMSYEQMTARLAILMAGRVSEEIIFGKEKVTSGASSDIEQATRLAKMMVTKWGYSDTLASSPTATTSRRCSWACPWAASRTSRGDRLGHRRGGRRLVEGRPRRSAADHNERLEDLHTLGARPDRVRDPQRRRDHRHPDGRAAGPRQARGQAAQRPVGAVPLTDAQPQPAAR